MPITRNEKIGGGIFAGVLATAALAGAFIGADDGDVSPSAQAVAATPAFDSQLGTPADFYDRFDYGFSGLTDGVYRQAPIHGDHNLACQAPTTLRDVVLGGSPVYKELFWHCAPTGDPSSGHVMTAVDTDGYNIAWFSPKTLFTDISKVCWDINETEMSHRKWTQVVFVSESDATKYPTGTDLRGPGWEARGSGGYDLGFTSPDFRAPNFDAPTSGIEPSGYSAGVKVEQSAPSWWQGSEFTTRYFGSAYTINNVTDKATRYTQCIENAPNNIVRFSQATPSGPRTFNLSGQIPQGKFRVVFQDDNYNGPKGDAYNKDVNTWHWDNIQVYTGGVTQPPPSTTSTTVPPTSSTVGTTSTVPATTTTASTTTTSTTTTTPSSSSSTQPSTSSTVPSDVVEVPRADLEALLASLQQLLVAIQALLDQ